ncbi:hypothetical protein ACE6H2_020760 [Prunus campanulata]
MKIRDGGEAPKYTPGPLNVESPVFFANVEHHKDTAPVYDANEENVQYEFVDVEIEEEFGEAEEVEVESDEAEGGEDDEEDGDFIDNEFEQNDEEDNMNFHRYVVSEEQDDGNKEPGEGDTDGYNTSDLESLHEDSEGEDVKKRGLRQPKFKQYNKQYDLLDPKFHLGLEFPNMQECRDGIKYYACKCARRIRVKRQRGMVRVIRQRGSVIRVRGMVRVKRVKMNLQINLKIVLGYCMLHMLGKDPLVE